MYETLIGHWQEFVTRVTLQYARTFLHCPISVPAQLRAQICSLEAHSCCACYQLGGSACSPYTASRPAGNSWAAEGQMYTVMKRRWSEQ